MSDLIRLDTGQSRCLIAPALGGALLDLELKGKSILRKAPLACSDPLETACFALVPFANRLVAGKSRVGHVLTLPLDPVGAPHALHGHGWRKPWTVQSVSYEQVRLEYHHQADSWPWTYVASQEIVLADDALQITLKVSNLSPSAMPCGVGLHPYFALEAVSTLETAATECLEPDALGVPSKPAAWSAGRLVIAEAPPSDCFLLDRTGQAWIEGSDWTLGISASPAVGWQFYRPAEGGYFCLEPVSHLPDQLDTVIEGTASGRVQASVWHFEFRLLG